MRPNRALILVALSAFGCGDASTDPAQPGVPTSLVISTDSFTTHLGRPASLPFVTLYDADHQVIAGGVHWSSADTTIAQVEGSHAIGHVEGATTFIVTSDLGSASGTVRVGVTLAPGSRITANLSNRGLFGDDSLQALAWVIGPDNDSIAGRVVTISALLPEIATITPGGMIHGHAEGTAQFLATSGALTSTLYLRVFETRVARLRASLLAVELTVGHEYTFSFHAYDALGNELHDLPVSLSSSDVHVVDVGSDFDTIHANHLGTAVITARCDTVSVRIPITVITEP